MNGSVLGGLLKIAIAATIAYAWRSGWLVNALTQAQQAVTLGAAYHPAAATSSTPSGSGTTGAVA